MAWADEKHEAEKEELRAEIAKLEAQVIRLQGTIKKLRGEKGEGRCRICFTDDHADHAGWCPRKGD